MSKVIESLEQLPDVSKLDGEAICFDVETTCFKDKAEKNRGGLDCHGSARAAGYGLASSGGWSGYLPLRHRKPTHEKVTEWPTPTNLPLEGAIKWLRELGAKSRTWLGWNINFDATVARHDRINLEGDFLDVMNAVKLVNENCISYRLKRWCADQLNLDTGDEKRVKELLKAGRTEDYGALPVDACAEYCLQDVYRTCAANEWINKNLPEAVKPLLDREIKLTKILFEMEWRGIKFDEPGLLYKKAELLSRELELTERLSELTGLEVNPESNDDVADMFRTIGVEPIAWSDDTGKPSYDDEVLAFYEGSLKDEAQEVAKTLRELRTVTHDRNAFVDNWLGWERRGSLHPSFNQNVRTGRMSCRSPNLQQVKKWLKQYIIARKGMRFVSADYSQIEYRVFADYAGNQTLLDAYLNDAATDFHARMAELVDCDRRDAKVLNFGVLYGMGFRKFIKTLSMLRPDLPPREREAWARMIYNRFHSTIPEMRTLAKRAETTARRRGFVFNKAGRRRNLEDWHCRKALNSLVQGTAADIVKERMVAGVELEREFGYRLVLQVHDELLYEVPDNDVYAEKHIKEFLERSSIPLKVPLAVNVGGGLTWLQATKAAE